MSQTNYLKGYAPDIVEQVEELIRTEKLAGILRGRYPENHQLRTDKALYQYTMDLKNSFLRKAGPLSKVIYDDKISLSHHALGLHSFVSRPQGRKTKAKNEIRISSLLKFVPEEMLRAVVVHELAHMKEKDHNKAFYNLCCHMESDYHQYEFDLRLYLALVDSGGTLHGRG
jgi:predicted metal-dependent hydrolase